MPTRSRLALPKSYCFSWHLSSGVPLFAYCFRRLAYVFSATPRPWRHLCKNRWPVAAQYFRPYADPWTLAIMLPGHSGQWRHYDLNLCVRNGRYQTCEDDILKVKRECSMQQVHEMSLIFNQTWQAHITVTVLCVTTTWMQRSKFKVIYGQRQTWRPGRVVFQVSN